MALSGAVVGALVAGLLAAGALLPAGETRDSQLGATPASAAIVLDRAADAAMSRAAVYPTARQYGYLKVETGSTSSAGQTSNAGRQIFGACLWQSETKQDWYKANGSGRERIVDTGRGFLTPSTARSPGLTACRSRSWCRTSPVMGSTPARGIGYWSVYKLAGLPTQSPALLRAIERELRATTGTPPAAANVFDTISNRLLFVSNSPSLRAALYRVIAHLPGVRLLGWRTDRIGRRGIAVAISHRDIREELLFDPATSEVLQTQEIQVAPFRSPKTPPLPAGTVLNYTVFISRGIVNSIKDLPGGGHVQFHPFVPGR